MMEASDPQFPAMFKQVKPPVKKLFYKGSWDWPKICVAVVGSRKLSSWGQRAIESLVPGLVEAGVGIVSGFMYGADQSAHKAALEMGGKTIAVLGWGIDWPVAESDIKLYRQIEEKGLILSEYEGETRPQLWMFPQRNRIVAGVSKAVIVVEAAAGSGSLITANLAIKFGRELFAVPGPMASKVSEGTNSLIKSGVAQMATSAGDILLALGISMPAGVSPAGGEANELVELLKIEPLDIDLIAQKIKMPVEKLAGELSLLQLSGLIVESNGKYYAK